MLVGRLRHLVGGLMVWLTILVGPLALAQPYQGFGASTRGGDGKTVYRVTNLNDDGPGSLRAAVSWGGRSIVFDVAGEIQLSRDIYVKGPFITIDGSTASPPGITLRNHGLLIHGAHGAHDIIVRSIRIRDSQGCDRCPTSGAGIDVALKAYNVVVDRVSVQGTYDQAITVGRGAYDVTIQWSIFAEGDPRHSFPALIGYRSKRVSFHHNLIIKGYERMPQVMWSNDGDQATETQVDLRNNLFWQWGFAGSQIWKGTKANVVANYYYAPLASEHGKRRAIYFCQAGSTPPQCDGKNPKWFARAYIADNVSGHGPAITTYLNGLGTESAPFPAPPVQSTDACTAARQVLENAGVRPLDATDQKYLGEISLVGCDQRSAPARR
jgi:pectate lyase